MKYIDYLIIKKQQMLCKVLIESIIYIEVEDNYSTIHTISNKYLVQKSLVKLKDILKHKNFEQIHRKFLVNFDKVQKIDLYENTVYLNHNFIVSLSERYKKQLISKFDVIK